MQVKCREVDVDVVRSVLSSAKSEYEETMLRETGKQYSVELEVDTSGNYLPAPPVEGSNAPSCSGGVILLSNHGKIRCNNTIDDRLQLTYANCIPVVRSLLFPKN